MDNEKIAHNRDVFLNWVNGISRLTDEDKKNVSEYLDNTDFFVAPASVRYKGSYPGGLCEHSLNVLENLFELYNSFKFDLQNDDVSLFGIPDSLIIVALFHDIGKIGLYKQEIKDKKVYNEDGTSSWVKSVQYSSSDDYIGVGSIEETSAYMVSLLIPTNQFEISAILNSNGFINQDSSRNTIGIFKKNKLAQYLYYANSMDMFNE